MKRVVLAGKKFLSIPYYSKLLVTKKDLNFNLIKRQRKLSEACKALFKLEIWTLNKSSTSSILIKVVLLLLKNSMFSFKTLIPVSLIMNLNIFSSSSMFLRMVEYLLRNSRVSSMNGTSAILMMLVLKSLLILRKLLSITSFHSSKFSKTSIKINKVLLIY